MKTRHSDMEAGRREFIKTTMLGGVAVGVAGRASAADAKNPPAAVRGRVIERRSGRGLADVLVTDGLKCVRTSADGAFELPPRQGAKFVSVTVPSGYSSTAFYRPITPRTAKHTFELDRNPLTGGNGCRFMQVTDSEIRDVDAKTREWITDAARIADAEKCAFIVHTGDICGRNGMVSHMMLMNDVSMGRPVRYCVGNHDLIEGVCGEEVFEALFGPCWHSFESGGIHFCVTPMNYGDYPPGYSMDDVAAWLENDLAAIPKDMPVILLGHMLCGTESGDTAGLVFGDRRKVQLAKSCSYRGFIYGHLHDTKCHRLRGTDAVCACSSQPVCGGIDLSPAMVRLVNVSADGKISFSNRHRGSSKWRDLAPECLWSRALDGGVMYATPVVSDGLAYVATLDDELKGTAAVYALDAESGATVWRAPMENSVKNRVLVFGGLVYAADAEGRIAALDARTGAVRWRHALPYSHTVMNAAPLMTPDGKTVVYGQVRRLAALDASTGKVRWTSFANPSEGVPHRFAVDGERVYGLSSWDGIYAYSLADGTLAWKIKDFGGCVYPGADPLLVDGHLYVLLDNTIREIEPTTGKEIRFVRIPRPCSFAIASGAIHYDEERLYVGTAKSGVMAIDRETLRPAWHSECGKGLAATTPYTGIGGRGCVSPIRLRSGFLCAPGLDGAIHFIDPLSGKDVHSVGCGTPFLSGAAETAAGNVIAVDFRGRARMFRPPERARAGVAAI